MTLLLNTDLQIRDPRYVNTLKKYFEYRSVAHPKIGDNGRNEVACREDI